MTDVKSDIEIARAATMQQPSGIDWHSAAETKKQPTPLLKASAVGSLRCIGNGQKNLKTRTSH